MAAKRVKYVVDQPQEELVEKINELVVKIKARQTVIEEIYETIQHALVLVKIDCLQPSPQQNQYPISLTWRVINQRDFLLYPYRNRKGLYTVDGILPLCMELKSDLACKLLETLKEQVDNRSVAIGLYHTELRNLAEKFSCPLEFFPTRILSHQAPRFLAVERLQSTSTIPIRWIHDILPKAFTVGAFTVSKTFVKSDSNYHLQAKQPTYKLVKDGEVILEGVNEFYSPVHNDDIPVEVETRDL